MFKPNNLFIKINDYHYSNGTQEAVSPDIAELPRESSPMGRIEPPGESIRRKCMPELIGLQSRLLAWWRRCVGKKRLGACVKRVY